MGMHIWPTYVCVLGAWRPEGDLLKLQTWVLGRDPVLCEPLPASYCLSLRQALMVPLDLEPAVELRLASRSTFLSLVSPAGKPLSLCHCGLSGDDSVSQSPTFGDSAVLGLGSSPAPTPSFLCNSELSNVISRIFFRSVSRGETSFPRHRQEIIV